jgi:hypothetical protein
MRPNAGICPAFLQADPSVALREWPEGVSTAERLNITASRQYSISTTQRLEYTAVGVLRPM